jgi:hypothetical protein
MVHEQLTHFGLQFRDAGGVARARDGGRLQLQHLHVLAGASLFPVQVLQAGRRADVTRIAVNGVGQVGFGPGGVG